jgi:hypothetical protein
VEDNVKNAGFKVLGAILMTVALFTAGCGGNSEPDKTVASAGAQGDTDSSASPKPTGQGNPVAYAQCMRESGVPNFPDPAEDGGIKIDPRKDGLDPNSSEFKKAEDKCKHLQGSGDKVNQSGDDLWSSDKKIEYAKCMRANGEPNFPDPDDSGQFPPFTKGGDIDPQSDRFKKAEEACKQHKPGTVQQGPGGPGGGGPAGGPGGGAA